MGSLPPNAYSPADEYERRLARRRDEATWRLTNVASLGLLCTPFAMGLLLAAVVWDDPTPERAVVLVMTMIACVPAAAAALLTLYDWRALPRGKIALGLLPWTLLVLGTTLILLAIA